MIIMGLDPGLGIKSALGVAILDTLSMNFITYKLWPSSKKLDNNLKYRELSQKVAELLNEHKPHVVALESFVMLGRSGQNLQRLIGALLSQTTEKILVTEISNTRLKQIIGGSGRSDKEEVANGLENYFFNKNKTSAAQVVALKHKQEWDMLDALAIAVSAYLLETKKV